MARLTDYLLNLAHHPEELDKFKSSKESATKSMDAAGLSSEHKNLLLEGNWVGLHYALNKEAVDKGEVATPAGGQSCTYSMSLTLTKNWQ